MMSLPPIEKKNLKIPLKKKFGIKINNSKKHDATPSHRKKIQNFNKNIFFIPAYAEVEEFTIARVTSYQPGLHCFGTGNFCLRDRLSHQLLPPLPLNKLPQNP